MSKIIRYLLYGVGGIFAFFVFIVIIAPKTPPPTDTKAVQEQGSVGVQSNETSTATVEAVKPKNETAPVKENSQPATQTNQPKTTQPVTQNPSSISSSAKCKITNYLPDSSCTPGTIDPRVTQENIHSTICVSGYSASVRPSTSVTSKIKVQQMAAYGDTDSPSNYELDHIISLELGGAPADPRNLFPEPYINPMGAREKDKVENYLHSQVCSGKITLALAQQEIATDWVNVYVTAGFTQSTSGTATQPTSTQSTNPTPTPIAQTSGKYYTSSYASSKYYYPEACSSWQSLSPNYLKAFNSLQELLDAYPSRTLSPQCQ